MALEIKSLVIDGIDYTNDINTVTFIDTTNYYEYLITLKKFILTPTSNNPTYTFQINDTTITETDEFIYELITTMTGTTIRLRKNKG